jgi:hypothetical protein
MGLGVACIAGPPDRMLSLMLHKRRGALTQGVLVVREAFL